MRWGAALLVLLLLAGCLEKPAPGLRGDATDGTAAGDATQGEVPQQEGRKSRQGGDEPGDSYDLVVEGTGDLKDVLELHWAYDTPAGAQTIELVLDFGKDNDCKLQYGQQTIHSQAGPNNLMLGEPEGGGVSWGTGSSGGGLATVHAAGVDTRSSSGGGGTGHLSGREGALSGTYRLTFTSVNWEGWGSDLGGFGFLPGDVTAAMSAVCEEPFSLTGARMGSSVLLAGAGNLAGGIGAESPAATANLQDSLAADLPSPVVRATCNGFGFHAAEAVLSAPSGETTWTFLPSVVVNVSPTQDSFVEDGPGAYTFLVDRAAAYFDAFWCAAWGLDADYDPVPDLRGKTAIDSPFD